jgi:hypothetical protein
MLSMTRFDDPCRHSMIMDYADVSCCDMLAHLIDTYGDVSPDDIQANHDSLAAD